MPALKERRSSPTGWALLALLGGAYVYGLWAKPLLVGGFPLVVAAVVTIDHFRMKRHLQALAAERPGESLCTFARGFEVRATDTWVIRAVYEQLQDHLKGEYASFPIRATDRLEEDLQLDPDDLALDIAAEIAERTGRSFANTNDNPYYGKVTTVADVVAFFCAQARSAGEQLDAADEARASSAGRRGPRS
jgi:hypothetical protein